MSPKLGLQGLFWGQITWLLRSFWKFLLDETLYWTTSWGLAGQQTKRINRPSFGNDIKHGIWWWWLDTLKVAVFAFLQRCRTNGPASESHSAVPMFNFKSLLVPLFIGMPIANDLKHAHTLTSGPTYLSTYAHDRTRGSQVTAVLTGRGFVEEKTLSCFGCCCPLPGKHSTHQLFCSLSR